MAGFIYTFIDKLGQRGNKIFEVGDISVLQPRGHSVVKHGKDCLCRKSSKDSFL